MATGAADDAWYNTRHTMTTEEKQGHEYYMKLALGEAERAFAGGEVPVGALLVKEGRVIGSGHNLREATRDPSGHAEMLVLRRGGSESDSWRLAGVTLYVTKEPCIMCAGAMVNARISRLVYGCRDEKAGGVDSLYSILNDARLNHQVEVVSGVLEEECAELLRRFFRERR
ncbi:MAG: tRNA adenosine(34) deaminase TadA [Nitrospiraceae bacterium]|nr:tRNA adenosine(34) deaminase TadA [Nitrospiraceae bacterium]